MIEIDVDESAAALVSLLEEHMREDGIWDYAVEFLVSMATDGASVMLGKENGFCKLFGEALGKTLFCHHCLGKCMNEVVLQ